MAIKRYVANADTTITNAFKADLTTRGTGSNMGAADVLEVFSIYGQSVTTGSGADSGEQTQELSRILLQFPVSGTTVFPSIVLSFKCTLDILSKISSIYSSCL